MITEITPFKGGRGGGVRMVFNTLRINMKKKEK